MVDLMEDHMVEVTTVILVLQIGGETKDIICKTTTFTRTKPFNLASVHSIIPLTTNLVILILMY
jgi:hypothetical protein